jgi:hypothetical protein
MLEKLSSEFNFNPRRSPLADLVAEKLQEAAQHGASNNAADRHNEGGKRFS